MQTVETMRRAIDTPREPLAAYESMAAAMMMPRSVTAAVPVPPDILPQPSTVGPIGAPDPDVMWRWIMQNWMIAGGMYEQLYEFYRDWIEGSPSRMDLIWIWIEGTPSRLDQLWEWHNEWNISGNLAIDGGLY